eukprot:SAG11_NODE_13659_length_644_cov_15.811009_1_plen_154_part_01
MSAARAYGGLGGRQPILAHRGGPGSPPWCSGRGFILSREARIGEALRLHWNQNAVLTPVADDEENAVVSVHGRRHVKHVATDGRERNRCSDRAPGAREWRVVARLEADAGRTAVAMFLNLSFHLARSSPDVLVPDHAPRGGASRVLCSLVVELD